MENYNFVKQKSLHFIASNIKKKLTQFGLEAKVNFISTQTTNRNMDIT